MTWYKTGIRLWTMPERPMSRSSKRLPLAQLKLFHPTVRTPTWNALPKEVRQRVLPLLARLMREAAARDRAVGTVGGPSDE
jgi:hypothetical protein